MSGREGPGRLEAGTLPAFDRLAPPPPLDLLASRIEALSSPGDIVVDLHGRGGWVARAALAHQRRAFTFESTPLSRLLADVVLRPPDIRHLDAAFQAIAAAPRQESSLKVSLAELFTSRCVMCGRSVVVDEFIWEAAPGRGESSTETHARGGLRKGGRSSDALDAAADEVGGARPRLIRKHYRCMACRGQQGGSEHRQGPVDETDLAVASAAVLTPQLLAELRDRFPGPGGHEQLADELLGLHSARQLIGLQAILRRIETDLRAAPVIAALRLSLLQALLVASRLNGFPGRVQVPRIVSGRLRPPGSTQFRERHPWLAFEEGYRQVRGFVQLLEASNDGPLQARLGDDLLSLADSGAHAIVRLGSPAVPGWAPASAPAIGSTEYGHLSDLRRRMRLVIGQAPLSWPTDRLSYAYFGTAWVLGREAAATLPLEALFASVHGPRSGWQVAALRRSLEAIAPVLARDARVILLVEPGGAESTVATALAAAGSGYRVAGIRQASVDAEMYGWVELVPPGAALPGSPRSRANQPLPAVPGGAGDPDLAPGRGLFGAPERFDRAPFSTSEAVRVVTETAVDVLKARGEPASTDRLLSEVLVGLDRSGHLRRFAAARSESVGSSGPGLPETRSSTGLPGGADDATGRPGSTAQGQPARPSIRWGGGGVRVAAPAGGRLGAEPVAALLEEGATPGAVSQAAWSSVPAIATSAQIGRLPETGTPGTAASPGTATSAAVTHPPDPVEVLLDLIRGELSRPDNRRLTEIEPDRWWLGQPADQETAAVALADRLEWAVFSLLATAGRISEPAFLARISGLFQGHDLPDAALVRTCLESYRSLESTREAITPADDLLTRSQEHAEVLATLVELGHRLGMRCWIGRREQGRRVRGRTLGDWLDDRELNAYLPIGGRASPEVMDQVDCIWYVRTRAAFLFEVEWTAMLGELFRRHARIPTDERTVRFLVIAPERTELLRLKLERSPLARRAFEEGNWHVLKFNHLRTFASRAEVSLNELEPFLGLDPAAERQGDQLPLFGGGG